MLTNCILPAGNETGFDKFVSVHGYTVAPVAGWKGCPLDATSDHFPLVRFRAHL